jgi:RimJ/RimL family protein N-acetyltransferase
MDNINLMSMDEQFLKTIKDYKKMYYNPNKNNFYYTIIYNGNKAGITGIILENNLRFFQIALHSKYRGKGLLKNAVDLIAQKHNLNIIFSTIESDNISSIKAHEKAGFKSLPKNKIKELIKLNKLEEGQTRMYKKFKIKDYH